MTRTGALIVLGILVFVAPFSGLPTSWLSWILPLCGFLIAFIGASLRKAHNAPLMSASRSDVDQTGSSPLVGVDAAPTHPSAIS